MEIEELSQTIQRLVGNLNRMYADNELLKGENAALKEENAALKHGLAAMKEEVVALNEENTALKQEVDRLGVTIGCFESANVMCVQNEMQIHARIRPFDAPENEEPAPKRGGGGKKTSL